MQLDILVDTNMRKAQADFAALQAQIRAVNKELAATTLMPQGGSPAGFARAAKGARYAADAYNNALAASGAFRVEQLRVNEAVSKNTELLQKQQLSFRQVWGKKNRNLMRSMYREQLALQRATAAVNVGGVGNGKTSMSLAIPTGTIKSWDTFGNRVGWVRAQLASGSQEMINWGKNTQWAGRQLTAGLTMPMVAFGAAAAVMAYQTDKQLTRIAKVYDTTANQNSQNIEEQKAAEKELMELREQGMETAINAAKEYGSAATDTLKVQAELAATGLKGAKLQQSTAQVMRITTLGELDQAVATKALISLQAVLGLTAKETGDAFNYLNAIENATSLSTDDFATAIPKALGPMKEMGGTLQDLSVLLVAMKERGIDAGEGANAIKAMMQRLYRPSVKVREEWKELANVDPLQIVEESGGKIMDILPKISEAVAGMDRPDRVKLLAGLFGTYQVTRMSAMLSGIQDMNEGIGQTTRVLEVNEAGWESWGDTAERELTAIQESASGKFKIALESVKAELADMGEPFLEVATWFLKAAEMGLALFNQMPDWAKKGAAIVAILAAIVGPSVMLVGLFANFAGNIGKMVAFGMKWFSTLELINKSQIAARISAQLAETQFMKEANATQTLTQRIEALTLAVSNYAKVMAGANAIQLKPGMLPSAQMPSHPASHTFLGMPGGRTGEVNTAPLLNSNMSKQERVNWIRAQADEQRKVIQNQHVINQQGMAQQNIAEKTSKIVNTTSLSTAAMAVSMGLMVGTSNDIANNIGKWLMIGSFILPAVTALGPAMMKVASAAKSAAAAQIALRAASAGTAASTLATAGAMGSMKGALLGARAGALAIMGPIGWAATAAAAIGAGFYAYHKHQQGVISDEAKAHENLVNAAERWNEVMGNVEGHYKTIATISPKVRDTQQVNAAYDAYKSGELKDVGNAFKALDTAEARAQQAGQIFLDLQVKSGMSAKEAANNIRALFLTAGYSITEADTAVRQIRADLMDVTKVKWGAAVANQAKIVEDALSFSALHPENSDAAKAAEESGKEFAEIWSNGFAEADSADAANALMDQLETVALSRWQMTLNEMMKDASMRDFLSDFGISDAQGLSDFFNKFGKAGAIQEMSKYNSEAANTWAELLSASQAVEQSIVGNVSETNRWGDAVKNVDDVLGQAAIKAKTFSLQGATADAVQLMAALTTSKGMNSLGLMTDETLELQRATAMATINSYNLEHGFRQGKTAAQALKFLVNQVAEDTSRGAAEADNLAGNLRKIPRSIDVNINIDQIGGIVQSGMSGVVDDIASATESRFDSSMESAISSAQAGWDAKIAGQEAAQQRQQDAFDARWDRRKEKVEEYYEAREKALDKAIEQEEKAEELRQRIFEAEMTRIERLAEARNKTIDLNLALRTGDLDEAAKISNDLEALDAEWVLGDAKDSGARKSEKRVEKLNDRKERVGEQKDAAMERLEKQEEAERRHLERVQQMRSDALKAQSEAAMNAYKAEWDARKENLNQQLELFKAFIPKNQAELKRWITQMQGEFTEFGENTLNPLSDEWAKFFQESFKTHIRQAGTEVANDNMWQALGNKQALALLQGFGFSSLSAFEKFVKSGDLPADFGKLPKPGAGPGTGPSGIGASNPDRPRAPEGRHEGGLIGSGAGSRKGVARNLKGLHPNEKMIRAQIGEYVWDKKTYADNKHVIEGIQKGIYDPSKKGIQGGFGGAGTGLLAAAAGTMFGLGISRAISNRVKAQKKQIRAAGQGSSPASVSGAAYSAVGTGGRHRPINGYGYGGIHDSYTGYPAVDFAAPVGTPVYAVSNGVISSSYDITGYEPRNSVQNGYRSYGRVMYLKTDAGPTALYAHLSQRGLNAGARVKGGDIIGRTGNTGHSTGPHLHFGANNGPLAWLEKGGHTLSEGLAMLHPGETVLTKDLSGDLMDTVAALGRISRKSMSWSGGISEISSDPRFTRRVSGSTTNVASGGNTEYNVKVYVAETNADPDQIAKKVVRVLEQKEAKRPQARSNR